MERPAQGYRRRGGRPAGPGPLPGYPPGVPAGPAAHVAALYREVAHAITEGRPAHPGFGTAVHHHRTLAAIERAAQTGVRQPLAPQAEGRVALGRGQAASWPVSGARAELGLLADLFTRDQDVSAAKTRAALGWAPACTSIVKYLTALLRRCINAAGRPSA